MSLFSYLLMAAPQGTDAASGGGASAIINFLPLIAIIGIFYFLIIRPQSKKQKETQKMLSALKKGDKVVTIGGIHGVIQTVRENSVIVRVDESTKLEFSRSAVSSIVSAAKEEKDEKESDGDKNEKEKSDKSDKDKSDKSEEKKE
ncbi:MAG: preprotein translocase subunit YajC [Treponema sp.]|nr:preprotein translocase subunit YajC [Treponema sp.]